MAAPSPPHAYPPPLPSLWVGVVVGWMPPPVRGGWAGARGIYRGRSIKSKHPCMHICMFRSCT